MVSVFISHNKIDKAIARDIAIFLTAEDVSCWFDEWEIQAGDSIVEEINTGLRKSTHFIILWSANSSKSKWVRRELHSTLSRAIQSGNPRVIPVVLDSTKLPELLADIKYIRYNGGTEKDRYEIVRAVTGNAPSDNFIRAIVRKYHEVIYAEKDGDPFGATYCPMCGSYKLKRSSST